MNFGSIKKTKAFVGIVSAVLLLILGIAGAMDFHADGRRHDSCPLCRLQSDGDSICVQPAEPTSRPVYLNFLLPFQRLTTVHTLSSPLTHRPHAPPLV